jgi:hypothetical protein
MIVQVRWRDDGNSSFDYEEHVVTAEAGKEFTLVDFFRLGQYKTRQYEIVVTDDAIFSLAWVEEDVEKSI